MYVLKITWLGETVKSRHRSLGGTEKELCRFLRRICSGGASPAGLTFVVVTTDDPLNIVSTGFYSEDEDEIHVYASKGLE